MLIRPITPSSSAIRSVVAADLLEHLLAEAHRRQHAGRVAGVDAGLLDVLHDPGDARVSPSASASTSTSIAFSRKRSSSSGCSWSALTWRFEVGVEVLGRVTDLHRPTAEHVGRADQQREADLFGDHRRLLGGERRPVGRVLRSRACAAGRRSGRGPRRGRSRRPASRAAGRPLPRARGPASAASGRRTGRSPPRAAPARRPRARPRRSAARSRGGRRCRSRSRPSPGCS